MAQRGSGFCLLQGPGWLLLLYLAYAQGIAALDYDLGFAMGTHEPATEITEVGAAFWWGFAFGDLIIYMPLLAAGLIGHAAGRTWGRIALAAGLGITMYWPVLSLAVVVAARDAAGWNLAGERAYWIVLPPVALWAAWGLWRLAREG